MITGLRVRMGVLFVAFFLLISISVVATSWTLETEKQGALIINLTGRQRMLLQAMTRYALEIEKHPDEPAHQQALTEAVGLFETTLEALENGGPAPYSPGRMVVLSPAGGPEVRAQLARVRQGWTSLRAEVETVLASPAGTPTFARAISAIEEQSLALVGAIDGVMQALERAGVAWIGRLRLIQMAFLASAIALLLLGYVTTYGTVIRPLQTLQQVARGIGSGDLAKPVPRLGMDEVGQVGQSLETMRQQLHIARENLEAQVAQRTRELEALHEVSREISSHLELQHVLHSVTDKARELLAGDVAFLCLLEDGGQTLSLQAASGPREAVSGTQVPSEQSPASQVLAADRALPCQVDGCLKACSIITAPFRVSHLAAPLRVGDRVIGALCVGNSKAGAFSNEAGSLLTKLANSAAIALENARLYAQAERVATLEERQRIATEMHDGLAQALVYLGLKTEQVAELVQARNSQAAIDGLQRIRAAIDQAAHEVRRSIASLQQGPQPRQALQDRVAKLVGEFDTDGVPQVDLVVRLQSALLLPTDDTEQVLRVIREALLNVRHHAQAKHVAVRLEQQGAEALVSVEDDGHGFNPTTPPVDGGSHFGLSIMRARAARIGGQLTVDSAPGQGTRVILRWPVNLSPLPH